jgi:TatD DNase family protein
VLTDTHTHLYLPDFSSDLDALLEDARAQGVTRYLLPNVDRETMVALEDLADAHPGVMWPMMGLHPCSVHPGFEGELEVIRAALFARPERYVAVGEIGIDLHWEPATLPLQVEALNTQVSWALELNKPVVIHARKSFAELFEVLEARQDGRLRGVFHCFTGTHEEAKRALDLGFYLGIGGVVTFKNGGLQPFLSQLPLDRIVLETDAPYLAPAPHRGQRNVPSYLRLVADAVAALYGLPLATIARQTTLNAQTLFQWPEASPKSI